MSFAMNYCKVPSPTSPFQFSCHAITAQNSHTLQHWQRYMTITLSLRLRTQGFRVKVWELHVGLVLASVNPTLGF